MHHHKVRYFTLVQEKLSLHQTRRQMAKARAVALLGELPILDEMESELLLPVGKRGKSTVRSIRMQRFRGQLLMYKSRLAKPTINALRW